MEYKVEFNPSFDKVSDPLFDFDYDISDWTEDMYSDTLEMLGIL